VSRDGTQRRIELTSINDRGAADQEAGIAQKVSELKASSETTYELEKSVQAIEAKFKAA